MRAAIVCNMNEVLSGRIRAFLPCAHRIQALRSVKGLATANGKYQQQEQQRRSSVVSQLLLCMGDRDLPSECGCQSPSGLNGIIREEGACKEASELRSFSITF